MVKRWIVCAYILLMLVPVAWADNETNELLRVRQQAFDERRKEEEIQMLRLELEKLKLEVETRKTLADLGLSSDTTLSAGQSRTSINIKNIFAGPDGAHALLEVGGSRVSVMAGDHAGSYTVVRIEGTQVVLVDEKGAEFKKGLQP